MIYPEYFKRHKKEYKEDKEFLYEWNNKKEKYEEIGSPKLNTDVAAIIHIYVKEVSNNGIG